MNRLSCLVLAALAGCGSSSKPATQTKPEPVANPAPPPAEAPAKPEPRSAHVVLGFSESAKGAAGTVSFMEVEGGVEVTVEADKLTPGDHAFHIHEKGDCSAKDFASAGPHFNPGGHKHGGPDDQEHHAGDFGNLTAGKDGKVTKKLVVKGVTLDDGATSLIGKAFILHDKQDDLKSQPAGNAGARIACGVIESKPKN